MTKAPARLYAGEATRTQSASEQPALFPFLPLDRGLQLSIQTRSSARTTGKGMAICALIHFAEGDLEPRMEESIAGIVESFSVTNIRCTK